MRRLDIRSRSTRRKRQMLVLSVDQAPAGTRHGIAFSRKPPTQRDLAALMLDVPRPVLLGVTLVGLLPPASQVETNQCRQAQA